MRLTKHHDRLVSPLFLGLIASALLGCARNDNPSSLKAESAASATLSAEAAKLALVECLGSPDLEEKIKRFPDGSVFWAAFQKFEELRNVKEAPIKEADQDSVYIGDWRCDLKTQRFHSSAVMMGGGAMITLGGRFKLGEDGKWKAVLLGIAHGH